MNRITLIITIFLIFGLLGVPNGVFAQESSSAEFDITLQHNASIFLSNSFVPLLKGGGGGGRGGGSGRSGLRGTGYGSAHTSTGSGSTSSSNSGILNIITIIMGLSILAPLIWWKIKK